MHYTDDALWNFSLETSVTLLHHVTPINLIKFENKEYNFPVITSFTWETQTEAA